MKKKKDESASKVVTEQEVEEALFNVGYRVPGFMEAAFIKKLRACAMSEQPVLITGATGTGKELVAETIHKLSGRERFEPILLPGLTETLMESELFGHKKGSFTGALEDKEGIFEHAMDGTVFLDEIGDIPFSVQAKLLRVLDKRKYRPVGSSSEKDVKARIICATNKDQELLDPSKFRRDLYYRINVLRLKLPTLRECLDSLETLPHKEDFITKFFNSMEWQKYKTGSMPPFFTKSAIQKLASHHWPDNFRGLKNAVISAYEYNKHNVPNGFVDMPFPGRKKPITARAVLRKLSGWGLEIGSEFADPKEKDKIIGYGPVTLIDESMIEFDDDIVRQNTSQIKLKDILDYAKKEQARIVEEKITEILRSGKDIKSVLLEEGWPEKDYAGFTKKVRRITGKKITQIKTR